MRLQPLLRFSWRTVHFTVVPMFTTNGELLAQYRLKPLPIAVRFHVGRIYVHQAFLTY